MSSSRFAALAGLVIALSSIVACSSSTEKEEVDVAAVESELKLSGTRYLGRIQNGQTRSGYYFNPPRYRSFGFEASGGDEITVDIASPMGDAMGWITDASYKVLAYNDDASYTTLDSKVVYKVPSAQPRRSYRIVFRDYDLLDAHFSVSLSVVAAEPITCEYNGNTYSEGETFPSSDQCNDCTCTSGGVGCTKRACVCNPNNEPWRSYIGTPQQCMVIRYTCPANRRSFQNACGCGCEDLP
jgi:hypothetical protein